MNNRNSGEVWSQKHVCMKLVGLRKTVTVGGNCLNKTVERGGDVLKRKGGKFT